MLSGLTLVESGPNRSDIDDLIAAIGTAGATNTPLACMIMGIELFGATHSVYIAIACFVAYLCSGHYSVYLSQRVGVPNTAAARDISPDIPVRHIRDMNARARGDLVAQVRMRSIQTTANLSKRPIVMTSHKLCSREVGMVSIYMKPRKKSVGTGGRFGGGKPLYRKLVMQAKAAGIMNAVAHHTRFGYLNSGKLQDGDFEIPNPNLTMCVELIGDRELLEESAGHTVRS